MHIIFDQRKIGFVVLWYLTVEC